MYSIIDYILAIYYYEYIYKNIKIRFEELKYY